MLDLEQLTHAEVDALSFSVHAVLERPGYFTRDVPAETVAALRALDEILIAEAARRPLPPLPLSLAMPS